MLVLPSKNRVPRHRFPKQSVGVTNFSVEMGSLIMRISFFYGINICIVVGEAAPQTWKQSSKFSRVWDTKSVCTFDNEK